MSRPLSHADKVAAFRAATAGFARKHKRRFKSGMTDDDIAAALAECFGVYSGSASPGGFHITRQAAGLRLWASWDTHNAVREKPTWAGRATIAMAREVYGIRDPASLQMSLF